MRHVETLRRQRAEEDGEEMEGARGSARVELLGDAEEEEEEEDSDGVMAAMTHTATKMSHGAPSRSLHSTSSTTTTTTWKWSVNRKIRFASPLTAVPPLPRSALPATAPLPEDHKALYRTDTLRRWRTHLLTHRRPNHFRVLHMLKKKQGEQTPLRRSSSVRLTSQKFESNPDPNQEDEKTSNFQRNTRQRVSSRSIQEKMERLAQAAQKPEVSRSPDVTQRTLVLLEEVSRKRDLFEKEHQASSLTSPGVSRQEFRTFTSGISNRINRLINKGANPGSSPNPAVRPPLTLCVH
ncbi:hypothetical protein N1851_015600 [Merluccius polli]|uniref:Uncharacterized protein n=1 Tax=Merluccius polli TaxID=89951 RepID=A0AA47MSQ9_MERPO|nr:hypothetical protein N1851_015600 [Merluccius polli]